MLVVEDDPDIRESVTELVQELGFSAVEASNGRQALNMVQAGLQPDAIVLDIMMPIMDGKEFFENLPESMRGKVIVCSASSSRPAGAFAVLSKPFDLGELLLLLQALCGPAA